MGRSLLALSIFLLPLLEIAGFIIVGSQIGVMATLGLVLLSVVVGAMLVRRQGFGALRRAQAAAASGGEPDREIAHGAMILVAGVLLMIPGFITDIVGLALFAPFVRDLVWDRLRSRITVITPRAGNRPGNDHGSRPGSRVIDLDEDDYSEVDPGASPWRRNRPDH